MEEISILKNQNKILVFTAVISAIGLLITAIVGAVDLYIKIVYKY